MPIRAREMETVLCWEALPTPRSQLLFIHNLLPRIGLSSLSAQRREGWPSVHPPDNRSVFERPLPARN